MDHYNEYEYLRRLKELNLLPMEYYFVKNDLERSKKFTMVYAVLNFHCIFVTVVTKIEVDYGLISDPLSGWENIDGKPIRYEGY